MKLIPLLLLAGCASNVKLSHKPAPSERFSCDGASQDECPATIAVIRDSRDGRCWAYTRSYGVSAAFGPVECE